MPELPEVETVRRSMEINLGARVKRVDVRRADIVRLNDFQAEDMYEQQITDIQRRGKFLLINLGQELTMVVHMGMSGRFYMLEEDEEIIEKHVHFVLYLDNGKKLVYQDARRFGGIWFTKDSQQFFAHMGAEPLSKDFSPEYLAKICQNRRVAVKTLILNQQLISGIGNIYADESLYAAGIRPDRPAGSLDSAEIKRLQQAIVEILSQGVKERGTTFRDYRDGFNQRGNFQNYLKVYGRTNERCSVCGAPIEKEKIGGRSSHFCAHCQQ